MPTLTCDELTDLEKNLDDAIPRLPILQVDRDIALIHLCQYLENLLEANASRQDSQAQGRHHGALDAMDFALDWIFRRCPSRQKSNFAVIDPALVEAVFDLHHSAFEYAKVWELMSMVRSGWATVEMPDPATVIIRSAGQEDERLQAASTLLLNRSSEAARADVTACRNAFDRAWFRQQIDARIFGRGKVRYVINKPVFDWFACWQGRILSHVWEMDPEWSMGDYTLGEFRRFWICLTSLLWIHTYATDLFESVHQKANANVIIKTPGHWIDKISRWSALNRETVGAILHDCTYSTELRKSGKHVSAKLQPFLPLADGHFAVCPALVVYSNAERNLWKLMNLIRLDVWSSLNLKREKLWLAELQGLFQKFGFEPHTDIAVTHRDGSTNLDLLVLDHRNKAGIAFEVKWFNEPEGMNEVRIADREIRKGFGQAARCRDWLNARTLAVAQASGIPKEDLPNYRFMGAVLSRNTFGGGAPGVAEVPLLNERLLRSLLGRYGGRGFDLTAVWKDACDRTFLPTEGVHFRTSDLEVHFAGYHFIAKSIGFEPLKPWAIE